MHTHETAQAVFHALLDPETDLPHSARALGLPLSEFLAVADSPPIRAELDALERLAAIQARTVIIRALHSAALALERIAAGDDRPPAVVETCRKAASQILRLAGKSVAPPRDDPESPPAPDTPDSTPSPPDSRAAELDTQHRPTNPAPQEPGDRNSPAPQDPRTDSNRVPQQSNGATCERPDPATAPDHTAASVLSRLQSAQPATLREAFNSIADLVGGQAMETHTGRLAFKAGLERLLDTLPDAHVEPEPAAPEPDGIHALHHFTLRRPDEPPAHFALRLVTDSGAWRLENIIPLAGPPPDA